MFRFINLIYKTPEDLGIHNPKSLLPGIYYCKDSLGYWGFRYWTGTVWSIEVSSFIEAKNSPEEFKHCKPDGVRILGWFFPDISKVDDPSIRKAN
jgi:hypothetical protein